MKLFKLAAMACLLAPVCAQAQATKTIPLGGNWGLDTKIPVTFDNASFAKQFASKMNALRAMQAANNAPVAVSLPAQPEAVEQPVDKTLYTRDIVSREEILKSEAYQVTPVREWYVKKNSPSACKFYKGWLASEDMSFVQKGEARRSCESTMDKKYQTHTCAICGQPINGACGAVSTWKDAQGTHYAHADCFAAQRHQAAQNALLQNLDITEERCEAFDRQQQQRLAAQQQLMAQMKDASEAITLQAAQAPTVTFQPGTRPLKKVRREVNRFTARYQDELTAAAKAKHNGQPLTAKQVQLVQKLNDLRAELQRAVEREQAQ